MGITVLRPATIRSMLRVALVCALVCSLVGGGFIHAVVPHDEGDHHSQKEIVWNTLHAALGHEQKFSFMLSVALFLWFGTVVRLRFLQPSLGFEALAADQRHAHLRRGIADYRRFG